MLLNIDLIYLFLSSFLAATIFPLYSEAVLIGLDSSGNYNPFLLLMVATCGNVLGSCLNWILGRYLLHFQDRKWFFISPKKMQKYSNFYQRFGVWSLLFAWLPVIGDPLTFLAGTFKVNFWIFLVLVTIGKFLRYFYLLILFNIF